MRKIPQKTLFLAFLITSLALNACAAGAVQGAVASSVSATAPVEPTHGIETTPTTMLIEPTPGSLPDDLQKITTDNAASIREISEVQPAYPPYTLVSPNGRVGALADMHGINVYAMDSGELLAQLSVELPDCQYGWERYFSFNYDGSFLAIAARNVIQVWQVGGGIIYESPYSYQNGTDADTCGAEIPQLALSPDAGMLAVSGVYYTGTSAQAYFRVIATLQNRVLYEWNGSQDTLHGDLYSFSGLGFSTDGSFLQTFDPTLYTAFSGGEYAAFRFWSVNDWQELPRSAEALAAFPPAGQVYVQQNDEGIALKNRLDGQVRASLSDTGCTLADPCNVLLSPQVDKVALLDISHDTLAYHRETLATKLRIWDWQDGEQTAQATVFTRNLDGFLLNDDGQYQFVADYSALQDDHSDWWTSTFNFSGLLPDVSGVAFGPQVFSLRANDGCYFCGTCSLDVQTAQVSCRQGFTSVEGNDIQVETEAGQVVLGEQGKTSSENRFVLEMPADAQPGWDLRMLGYSDTYQTAFYCLDKDARPQVCAIYTSGEQDKLTEVEDIYALRFSPDGMIAVYINREMKALYLLNLQSGKLTKMNAYQSRAWFVNPAFIGEEDQIVYVVQNLNDGTILSLEWVDAAAAKVLRRTTLDSTLIGKAAAVSAGESNGLLALGAENGQITILDQEKGKLLFSWQAGTTGIIGLTFAQSDKLLVSLDQQGLIQFWGIE